jgi:sugar phosphate isomerase/epimerase
VQDNRIDFSAIVRGLREVDYAGYLCVEYVYVDWEGCNRTDNVSETLLLRELLSGCV